MLKYNEPICGMDEHGNVVTCIRTITMTEENIIKYMRWSYRFHPALEYLEAHELVDEYVKIYWAEKI